MAAWDPDDMADEVLDDDLDSEDEFDDEDSEDADPEDEDDDLDEADFDDEDDEDDELEDADDDEIDFCIALYREDGVPTGVALEPELANDFEGLIDHLQRIPGDAGALGLISLEGDVLVAVRVRGARHVQVFVSDAYFVDTWPLVRDAIDFLGLDNGDVPEEGLVGDLGMFADQGVSEMDLEAMFMDADEMTSEDVAEKVAEGMRFGKAFRKAVDDYWDLEDEA
ncbi:MAG: tRNA adenosine deaminase [Propionibacteriaceae bacterium]|jgi:putative tRNA adenosine deaminase-associated protein|nr:tRNA adenosine deaminase [Propionibacteriaceae bacterium]